MDIHQMRYLISRAYSGESWKKKVANMPADQVVAIYYKFAAQGKFDNLDRPVPKQMSIEDVETGPWQINCDSGARFEQLSFEDI